MNTTAQIPDWAGVAASVVLVLLAASLALYQRLGVARDLVWAAVGILLALKVVKAEPIVVVPVGGMVVSAAMSATALTMRAIAKTAVEQRPAIEARLSLGMTGAAAFAPYLREGVRTALIPAIDTTKVVGLIALPGAMTGLILAGVSPFDAI
ncbi:MAG: ABC transporter permease, partial [Actinobacteria bacterium]|nr:ABC transporter permease [Actinomycetota bacterium]